MSVFHRDLRMGRFLPPVDIGPRLARLANRMPVRSPAPPPDMIISDLTVPAPEGASEVGIRMYRPASAKGVIPVLVWMHGGGMVLGNHLSEEDSNVAFARQLEIAVVSVDYRLAPQWPAPAAVEDCYAVLEWLVADATALAIDPQRIALGGASAGGGLAAGTALLAHDRGRIEPAFQLLVYPMLDDRTVLRTDIDTTHTRFWRPGSNRHAWNAYLGQEAGGAAVSDYAAPGRRTDLSGLPPAWIGVGTLDLFYSEDVDYAERLRRAGIPAELVVVDGAFHAFDVLFKKKPVSRRFWEAQRDALGRALVAEIESGDDHA